MPERADERSSESAVVPEFLVGAICVFRVKATDEEDARSAVESIHDVGHVQSVESVQVSYVRPAPWDDERIGRWNR